MAESDTQTDLANTNGTTDESQVQNSPDSNGNETSSVDDDWGFDGRSGRSKETRVGLGFVMILVAAFSFVLWKKMDSAEALAADANINAPNEGGENSDSGKPDGAQPEGTEDLDKKVDPFGADSSSTIVAEQPVPRELPSDLPGDLDSGKLPSELASAQREIPDDLDELDSLKLDRVGTRDTVRNPFASNLPDIDSGSHSIPEKPLDSKSNEKPSTRIDKPSPVPMKELLANRKNRNSSQNETFEAFNDRPSPRKDGFAALEDAASQIEVPAKRTNTIQSPSNERPSARPANPRKAIDDFDKFASAKPSRKIVSVDLTDKSLETKSEDFAFPEDRTTQAVKQRQFPSTEERPRRTPAGFASNETTIIEPKKSIGSASNRRPIGAVTEITETRELTDKKHGLKPALADSKVSRNLDSNVRHDVPRKDAPESDIFKADLIADSKVTGQRKADFSNRDTASVPKPRVSSADRFGGYTPATSPAPKPNKDQFAFNDKFSDLDDLDSARSGNVRESNDKWNDLGDLPRNGRDRVDDFLSDRKPSKPTRVQSSDDRFGGFEPDRIRTTNKPSSIDRNRPASTSYTVQNGDNYWKISKKVYGTARYFHVLDLHNRTRVPDATKMRPGMKIDTPSKLSLESKYPHLFAKKKSSNSTTQPSGYFVTGRGEKMYRIGERDTLSQIALDHLGSSARWDKIYQLNRDVLPSPDKLTIGKVLRLPASANASRMARKPDPFR